MSDPLTQSAQAAGTYLNFELGDETMAIPVERVREILDTREIQPLPQAPKYILGFTDLRGDSIVVVDLRMLLGRPLKPDDLDTRMVVLWIHTGGQEQVIALRTDKVTEVTRFDDDRIEPIDTGTILNWDHRIISGLARRDGSYITVLDLDRMLSSEVVASLAITVDEESQQVLA